MNPTLRHLQPVLQASMALAAEAGSVSVQPPGASPGQARGYSFRGFSASRSGLDSLVKSNRIHILKRLNSIRTKTTFLAVLVGLAALHASAQIQTIENLLIASPAPPPATNDPVRPIFAGNPAISRTEPVTTTGDRAPAVGSLGEQKKTARIRPPLNLRPVGTEPVVIQVVDQSAAQVPGSIRAAQTNRAGVVFLKFK